MRRIEWLPSLLNHLQNDPILSEVKGHFIIPKSEYKGFDENNQMSPALWIIPLEATPIKQKGQNQFENCIVAIERVMICVAVRNSRNTVDNISYNSASGTINGAYVEASTLEDKVISSINKWNNTQEYNGNAGMGYINPFSLTELPAVDSHNGNIIMATIWDTKINFN